MLLHTKSVLITVHISYIPSYILRQRWIKSRVVINPWKDRSYFDQFRNCIVIPDEKRKPPRHAKQHKQQFQFYSKLLSDNWLKKLKMEEKQRLKKVAWFYYVLLQKHNNLLKNLSLFKLINKNNGMLSFGFFLALNLIQYMYSF